MTSMDIVKAGSLYRKSKVLRRWKKNWFVLYCTGDLSYFETENSMEPEETISVPVEVVYIKTGQSCGVDPPEGVSSDSLISLTTSEETMHLCAESPDDRLAWNYALDQARTSRPMRSHSAPPPYHQYQQAGAYPTQGPPGYYVPPTQAFQSSNDGTTVMPQQVIYHPDGQTTVIVGNGTPYCYRHRCHRHCDCCSNAGLGLGAGLAMGALMWSPFMWAPFFWC